MFDVVDYVKTNFNIVDIDVYEYGEKFKITFKINDCLIVDKLISLYDSISFRDKMKIFVDDGGYSFNVSSNRKYDSNIYDEMVSSYQKGDEIEIRIEIDKYISEHKMSIYNWKSFSECLNSVDDNKFLQTIDLYLKDSNYVYFEVFDVDIYWNTSTMFFYNSASCIIEDIIDRNKILFNSKDVCNFDNSLNISLIPDDFIIKNNYVDNPFTERFNKYSILFSLIYISNNSSISSEVLNLYIVGHRYNNYSFKISEIKFNEIIKKIYLWIYSEDNYVDKMLIARNLITLHCKLTNLLDIDEKTYSSIISNYQFYLKDNVNKFFDAKERVTEFINEISLEVKDDSLYLLKNFKTNIFAIFSFLLTVILANLVSDNPLDNILTYDIIIILNVILTGSVIYYLISVFELMFKLNKNSSAYSNLKNNYIDIFSKEDFNNIFKENMYENVMNTIFNYFVVYSIIWIGCICFLFILFNCIIL